MIINKVKDFWTDEDYDRHAELEWQANALDETITENMPQAEFRPIMEKIQQIMDEQSKIVAAVEARYIEARTIQGVIDDAREIVEAITKEDFKRFTEFRKKELEKFKNDDALAPIKKETEETYRNAYYYILFYLRVQLNAVAADKEKTAEITDFAKNKAAKWYPKDLSLPTVKYKKSTAVELTLDKMSYVFFGFNPPASKGQIDGQMSFAELTEKPKDQYIPVKYEKDGAPEITLYYNYSFDNEVMEKLGIEKRFDDEDFFILSFIDHFSRTGNTELTITKFFKEMTGTEPNTTQLTNLTNKLIKISTSNIFINDMAVRKDRGLDTYRLAVRRVAPIDINAELYIANGYVANSKIKINGSPVIMQLGYQIGQYTTVPKSLLYVKKKKGNGWRSVSRTPRFYRVLHYLLRRIATAKTGALNSKILYDTFYRETGERTTAGKNAAKKTMYEILEWFKHEGYITTYKEETTPTTGEIGVKITCPKDARRITKKK